MIFVHLWGESMLCYTNYVLFLVEWFNDKSLETHSLSNFREMLEYVINPLTQLSDQGIISPYNTNTISSRKAVRIKRNIKLGDYQLI